LRASPSLFYRDTPEAHGLLPDGPLRGRGRRQHAETSPGRSFTVSEARRTYTFWLFALTLVLTGFVMTAYTFHIVSIFDDAGMSGVGRWESFSRRRWWRSLSR
jgi:OFA family oxalate/formate antiporter-like MFS transporter